jgi:peptide/nickel transport system substrate-binding protein
MADLPDSNTVSLSQADSYSMSRRNLLRSLGVGAALGVGATVGLTGCGGGTLTPTATERGTPKRGGTLRAGLSGGGSDDSCNPFTVATPVDNALCFQLYDQLVELDANARPVLQLADEIAPNANADEWTIRVKQGVTFHNGKTMTADDILYTFQQELNPKQPGNGASILASLNVQEMKKLDNFTVRLPFSQPFSSFVDAIAQEYLSVVPAGFNPMAPVGTGPFVLESFKPGQSAIFSRNSSYWQSGLPYFDGLVFSDFADETSQVNAIESGQVDAINLLTIGSVDALRSTGYPIVVSPSGGFNPFTMRADEPPFNDVRVRQAFSLIIDRKQMLDLVFGGYGTIGNDLYSIWDSVYDGAIPQRQQDIAKARFLLKQAGCEGLAVKLVTAPFAQGVVSSAEVFAQQAKAAGVTVTLDQLTVSNFYGPSYLSWGFAQDTWNYVPFFLQTALAFLPSSAFDEPHWHNATFSALYFDSQRTTDQAKQREYAFEMQRIFWEQCPYLIPNFAPIIDGHSAKLQGVVPSKVGNSFNNFDFKSMWFD